MMDKELKVNIGLEKEDGMMVIGMKNSLMEMELFLMLKDK